MKDFCIIGLGVLGSTIAHTLSGKYSLDIYDKPKVGRGRPMPLYFY